MSYRYTDYETKLNFLKDSMSIGDFIQLVMDWNRTSPQASNTVPADAVWQGEPELNYVNGHDIFSIKAGAGRVAVMDKRGHEPGGRVTECSADFYAGEITIKSRATSEALLEGDEMFLPPDIIDLLEDRGFLADDYGIDVSRWPHTVEKENVNDIADIVENGNKAGFPIVYVSRLPEGSGARYRIDVNLLAERLKGAAHVLVQGEAEYYGEIWLKCGKNIETGGEIGVYFPGGKHEQYRVERKPNDAYNFYLERMIVDVLSWHGKPRFDARASASRRFAARESYAGVHDDSAAKAAGSAVDAAALQQRNKELEAKLKTYEGKAKPGTEGKTASETPSSGAAGGPANGEDDFADQVMDYYLHVKKNKKKTEQ